VHRPVVVVVVVVIAGCWTAEPPKPSAPLPIAARTWTCTEAALGLERGTVDVRSPDTSVVQAMRARCTDDAWPALAIECFAKMRPGDLGHCAAKLADTPRNALFDALGTGDDRTEVAVAEARLDSLEVNIAECDRFLGAVRSVIACEAVPIAERAELGREVSDVWSLPTHGLPADAVRRMADACTEQLADLEKQATGCTP